ncbi:MAG: phenylacetate-CoA oxygenase/reductase subunit PaaK [Burkholderiales bacterium]|nr:phenylacetate-CoA oxygenase/reductase subunit PaaK [Burkholderiales bacterium]
MTPHFHALRIGEVRRETADAVSVRFDVPPDLQTAYRFTQGQHVTLRTHIGGEELRRSYSICAGADDDELRVAIKRVSGGRFSGWVHEALRPGDVIDVMTPDGRFHTPLNPAHRKHYVAFVAGSGITPVLSLIRTTLRREPNSRFTLLYGNRRQADVLFHETLEDLKDRYLQRFVLFNLFSRENRDVALFNGRLDGAKVQAFLDTLLPLDEIDEAFVCGPGAMIDDVEATLTSAGMPREHVHLERFGVPPTVAEVASVAADTDAAIARVTVILDGVRREIDIGPDGGSILDAALRAGLDLPFSCKGGMCCTCRAKVLEGRIRMDRNYSLEAADVAAGYVLTCQAHPQTDRVTVSFDER